MRTGTLKGKELLREIIKKHAQCFQIQERHCPSCLVHYGHFLRTNSKHMPCAGHTQEMRYKLAVEIYVAQYGKDPELIEILMGQDSTL